MNRMQELEQSHLDANKLMYHVRQCNSVLVVYLQMPFNKFDVYVSPA